MSLYGWSCLQIIKNLFFNKKTMKGFTSCWRTSYSLTWCMTHKGSSVKKNLSNSSLAEILNYTIIGFSISILLCRGCFDNTFSSKTKEILKLNQYLNSRKHFHPPPNFRKSLCDELVGRPIFNSSDSSSFSMYLGSDFASISY